MMRAMIGNFPSRHDGNLIPEPHYFFRQDIYFSLDFAYVI